MPGPMVLNDRSRSFCFWYPGDVSACPSLLLGNPLMKTGPSSVSGNWGPCQSGTCFKFVTDTMRSNDSLNAQQPNMQNCSLRKTSRTSYAKSIREIKLAAPAISIHVSRFYLSLLRQQHNMSGVDWLCPTWWVGQGSPAPDVSWSRLAWGTIQLSHSGLSPRPHCPTYSPRFIGHYCSLIGL